MLFFVNRAKAHIGAFYRDANNAIPSIWEIDYPGFIYRPFTALDTEFQQRMQAPLAARDFVNNYALEIDPILAQPNTVSDYNEQTGNVIQRTVSSHYPRPEVKEKPFLNSDFLKMVSNG